MQIIGHLCGCIVCPNECSHLHSGVCRILEYSLYMGIQFWSSHLCISCWAQNQLCAGYGSFLRFPLLGFQASHPGIHSPPSECRTDFETVLWSIYQLHAEVEHGLDWKFAPAELLELVEIRAQQIHNHNGVTFWINAQLLSTPCRWKRGMPLKLMVLHYCSFLNTSISVSNWSDPLSLFSILIATLCVFPS